MDSDLSLSKLSPHLHPRETRSTNSSLKQATRYDKKRGRQWYTTFVHPFPLSLFPIQSFADLLPCLGLPKLLSTKCRLSNIHGTLSVTHSSLSLSLLADADCLSSLSLPSNPSELAPCSFNLYSTAIYLDLNSIDTDCKVVRVRQPLNSPTGSQIGINLNVNGINGGDKLDNGNGQQFPTSPTKVECTKESERKQCELGTKAQP